MWRQDALMWHQDAPIWRHHGPSWLHLGPTLDHHGPSWLHLNPLLDHLGSPKPPQISFGSPEAPRAEITFLTSPKPCKVCKIEKMTPPKPCKVCKIAKSTVTTMGSQPCGASKTQYVCHLIFHIALTLTFQPLFFRQNRVPIRSNRVIFATKIFCETGGAPKHCKVFKISPLGRSSRVENGRGMFRDVTTPKPKLQYIR